LGQPGISFTSCANAQEVIIASTAMIKHLVVFMANLLYITDGWILYLQGLPVEQG
jgi:hypothetical protein